jgi:hypothetical protein
METKLQTWRDDLRLPCLVNPADTEALVTELELLRKPPLPFQSKHVHALKRNKWFVLKRDKTRRGLVVVWPERQCCVYISGDVPGKRQGLRIALLRVRIDPAFFTGGLTVFAATLTAETRILSIEDTLIWKGRPVLSEEPFSKRWLLVVQWIEHYCILDARLLGGLNIQTASWAPLATLRPTGTWLIQSDDVGRLPLIWTAQHKELVQGGCGQSMTETVVQVPTLDAGPLIAIATRDSGPEQWTLAAAEGTSLGRALIRRLTVSQALRSAKSNTVRVVVEWSGNFNKWEICGLTDLTARHSSAFLIA